MIRTSNNDNVDIPNKSFHYFSLYNSIIRQGFHVFWRGPHVGFLCQSGGARCTEPAAAHCLDPADRRTVAPSLRVERWICRGVQRGVRGYRTRQHPPHPSPEVAGEAYSVFSGRSNFSPPLITPPFLLHRTPSGSHGIPNSGFSRSDGVTAR